MSRKLERPDGVVLQILFPLLDDLIRRDIQLRRVLGCSHFVGGQCGLVLIFDLFETDDLACHICEIDAGRRTAARTLRGMVRRNSQEQRFAVTAASIVDGERFSGIDADADFCRRMIGIFTRLSEHVDNELAHCDGTVNPVRFRIVRLRYDRVQTLIMEVDEDRIHTLQDAMHSAVMQIQET